MANLRLPNDDQVRLAVVSVLPLLYSHWHQATVADHLNAADLTVLGPHLAR